MNYECAIAVFECHADAAEAIFKLQQDGIDDRQVSLVIHDAEGEIPSVESVQTGDQRNLVASPTVSSNESSPNETDVSEDGGIFAKLGATIKIVADQFFDQFILHFRGNQEIACSVNDYQKLISDHHLLVVVSGLKPEVERAAESLAETSATQVNVHYAPEMSAS